MYTNKQMQYIGENFSIYDRILFFRWQARKTPYERKTAHWAVFQGHCGWYWRSFAVDCHPRRRKRDRKSKEYSPEIFNFRANGILDQKRVDFFDTQKKAICLRWPFFADRKNVRLCRKIRTVWFFLWPFLLFFLHADCGCQDTENCFSHRIA